MTTHCTPPLLHIYITYRMFGSNKGWVLCTILGPVYLHSVLLLSGTAISMFMCVSVRERESVRVWVGIGRWPVSSYTAVWKSHGFKTTRIFRYTVFCGMHSFFYVSSKTESAGLPQLCAVKSERVTRPLLLRLLRGAVSESHLCVWWWPKEMNAWNVFPRRKTRSLPYGNFSGNADLSCSVHNDVLYRWHFSADR